MLYNSFIFRFIVFFKSPLAGVSLRKLQALLVGVVVGSVFYSAVYATHYQATNPTEQLHLQLSETVTTAGKTLWLQGVLVGKTKSDVLYVEVMSEQGAVWQGIYPIRKRIAQGSISLPDTLASGWYQVRAYTQWMRNAGAASFATRPLLVINPYQDGAVISSPPTSASASRATSPVPPREIIITLDQKSYQPRDTVSVSVRWDSSLDTAWVAVSVRKVHSLDYHYADPKVATTGPVDQPLQYPIEGEGLTIGGRVQEAKGDATGRMAVLTIPGPDPYFEYTFVDSARRFYLPVQPGWQGAQDAILQMSDTSLRVQWTLDEKFAPENTYASTSFPVLTDSVWQTWQAAYAQRAQVNDSYVSSSGDSADSSSPPGLRFYGAPNYEIILDEYTPLPTFLEVNRELLVGVRLRERQGRYDMDVFDIPNRTFLEGEPSVLIDGVLIHDVDYLVNFPPDQIERIETVNRRTYYGEYRFDGTVAVYTKSGGAYESALPPSALQTTLLLYTPYQAFTTSDSLTIHEPDFRTLLHWQPNVVLAKEPRSFRVANADELGEFEVVVTGITTDGQPIHERAFYTVSLSAAP